ncbi:hypothetical protein [Helicobacter sp. 13S00477-4]|uniref:hypothetical protein n=1 Tax=Helicobacter sp. 13S00477-4 TaxID=1905759 RepID=UPI000BA7B35A|nr:hypothetical protein [Helicobacter sp. 13S00477-4]PAF50230.1 hypothetical protein BKH44_08535 [Helicobacter sp. 13S00477-4]
MNLLEAFELSKKQQANDFKHTYSIEYKNYNGWGVKKENVYLSIIKSSLISNFHQQKDFNSNVSMKYGK